MDVHIKRAYVDPAKSDGYRVLIDRIWRRGVSKEDAKLDVWIKALAPSTELRKWFGHDPERWDEFRKRYCKELDASDEAQQALADLRKRAKKGRVTLDFAARDEHHTNAVVLQSLLLDNCKPEY